MAPNSVHIIGHIIQYCIKIDNSSIKVSLLSWCGVESTRFLFNYSAVSPTSCDTFDLTIFGYNVVGNGSIQSLLNQPYYKGNYISSILNNIINDLPL